MKKFLISMTVAIASAILSANPLLKEFKTPHQTVPFDKITLKDYKPAFTKAIQMADKQIDQITSNRQEPTFDNTIEALERAGKELGITAGVFFNLLSAESNDEMMQLSGDIQQMLTIHSNNLSLNEKLFRKVKAVYDKKDQLNLTQEQSILVKDVYDGFVRSGANLSSADKEVYKELTQKLSKTTLTFGQNVLKATNSYQMLLTNPEDVKGLPVSVLTAAAEKAKGAAKEGWIFDLSAPSYIGFMKYAQSRERRKELYLAYNTRAFGDNFDNVQNIKDIVNLRLQMAQLLGYKNFAAYSLVNNMANTTDKVYNLLNQLLESYKPKALQEMMEIQGYAIGKEGASMELMPWDFSFYSNELKDKKYTFSEEQLRPYFELENVKKGVFGLAQQLYGITFKKNTNIPVYHPEVEAFEVFDKEGKFISVFYTDFHPRAGKRQGAWMTQFKGQYKENGQDHRPHVAIVMNFTRPTEQQPALLTFNEVTTFLHEFGHALHGIFADGTYESLSGTSVPRDFVELPSQIMENWALEKEFLDQFAFHYQTKEKLPESLIESLLKAERFDVGYACLRQLSFGYIDMAFHTLEQPLQEDVKMFETRALSSTQLLPTLASTSLAAQFNHIFAGGYAAGYYSYKWSEVLDADAFACFKEAGIFNTTTADSFRKNILSKGKTAPVLDSYIKFRKAEPSIDALLKRDGIR